MKHDKILKIYIQKLKYFRYSDNTIESYSHYVEKFFLAIDKYPQHLVSSDFSSYLIDYNFTSHSQQSQIISSIKFLYEKVLNKKYSKIDFQRPRAEKRLPRPIDQYDLINKLSGIENIKHKAILSLAFSCALRVSEVVNLKIEDIDSKRMLILIKQAKGRKDRYVPLTDNLLKMLRSYFRKYKPEVYLFNGQFTNKYSVTSCNKIYKKYIDESTSFHNLRHSGATAMHENGTDLRLIQVVLGHKNIKTTEIYSHISNTQLHSIKQAI